MEKKIILKFITGNKNKAAEVEQIIQKILPEVTVEAVKVDDIPELQGEPEEISIEKLKYARSKCPDGLLMVEDTSLCFEGYKGLPGPYIKHFLDKIGLYGLHKMATAMDDESKAYAQCIFALSESADKEPKVFIGRTQGKIVSPRGPENFGWDPIFLPNGKDKTFAELPKEEKNSISHRYKALDELSNYIKTLL